MFSLRNTLTLPKPMNKYLTKIDCKIACINENTSEQFDEQFCLIEARKINKSNIKASSAELHSTFQQQIVLI